MGSAAGISQETLTRTADIFNSAAGQTQKFSAALTDTMVRGAETAVDMTRRMAEQSGNVVWMGMQVAAGANGRIADEGFGRSQNLLGSFGRVLDIYRSAGESSASNLQALFASGLALGRGLQQLQQASLETLQRSLERSARKPQDLLRTRDIEEFALIQRDLYVTGVNLAMELSSTLLQIAGKVAQDAGRPLQSRAA